MVKDSLEYRDHARNLADDLAERWAYVDNFEAVIRLRDPHDRALIHLAAAGSLIMEAVAMLNKAALCLPMKKPGDIDL